MVKPKLPKVFKVKKPKETPDTFVLRYKNLSKQQIKEFRSDVDQFCQAYFAVDK